MLGLRRLDRLYGAGVMNYLSAPDFPTDTKGTEFMVPGGYIPGGDLAKYQPIKIFGDDFLGKGVKESVQTPGILTPLTARCTLTREKPKPQYTDFQDDG